MTTTTPVIAWKGDPAIKKFYLNRVLEHQILDRIIQGEYWNPDTQQGCSVGCTLHSEDHRGYERELGFPLSLAYLQEMIFEALSPEDAHRFPYLFLSSIEVGVDLSPIFLQFVRWLLVQLPCDPDDPWREHILARIDEGNGARLVGLSLQAWYRENREIDRMLTRTVFYLADACQDQRNILGYLRQVLIYLSYERRRTVPPEAGDECLFQMAREARDVLFALLQAVKPVEEVCHATV